MSLFTLDCYGGTGLVPKRGDLLVSLRRGSWHRTWFVIAVKPAKPARGVPRFKIHRERWWLLEPETRMRLFRYAERHGGQVVIEYTANKPKKRKQTFEQLMSAVTPSHQF